MLSQDEAFFSPFFNDPQKNYVGRIIRGEGGGGGRRGEEKGAEAQPPGVKPGP